MVRTFRTEIARYGLSMSETENSAEFLFSCPRFDVYQNEQGKHMIKAPDGVGIVALDQENHILMTREFRPHLNKEMWRIPAGKNDPGESFQQTAHRELREETGYDAHHMEMVASYDVDIAFLDRKLAFFIARDLFKSPLDTGDELIPPKVHFMAPKDVLELLNNGQVIGDIAAVLYRFLHVNHLV